MKSPIELNAELNLFSKDGSIQFDKDKEAARQYFLQEINPNTVFFHDLEEKLDYLFENDYYERSVFDQYTPECIKSLYKHVYGFKFRFPTYMGAYKFYTQYALKTFNGERFLERYEDRVVANALLMARGDEWTAFDIATEMITGRYQPATPTFLNAGKRQRGEYSSCFLMDLSDDMEGISRVVTNALQLSKRGGGVAINLSNLREHGAPIKHIENQSSGVIPVMKILEDSFSYANQLGARQGAGAVYLHAHHPDIMQFLDTKRENADEKIRIKTLSLGVVIPDITYTLAKNNETMYLFSPYDVKNVYGKDFSELDVSSEYRKMVDNPDIRKKKINAREFFQTLAEIQFESGYPYILNIDTVNRASGLAGTIKMSNLCSEIVMPQSPSTFTENGYYDTVGRDISCNLGSMNVAKAMESHDFEKTVDTSIRALSSVADLLNVASVPTIERGNALTHSIGLGQMNLHGYLASQNIQYGSEESFDFWNIYMYTVLYYALKSSNTVARERGEFFYRFEESTYADGTYFNFLINDPQTPQFEFTSHAFEGIHIPTRYDWEELRELVRTYGLYNQLLQAIPPTGSISYISHSTSSIHPVASAIEIRKEGKLGRVYYPAYGMTNSNTEYYADAYAVGYEKIIDMYAISQKYVDQSQSLTLFFTDEATTRDLNKAYIYAWRKGIKSLYYIRIRQIALDGTQTESVSSSLCESCAL